jgi:hypothetical protein
LGAVLLGWAVLALLAPELAALIAVFGSPVLAFFIIIGMAGSSSGRRR